MKRDLKKLAGLYVAWLMAAVMLVLAVIRPAEITTSYGARSYSGIGRLPSLPRVSGFPRAAGNYRYSSGRQHGRNDFYTFLRWICCAAFTYSAVRTYRMKRALWTWIFGILAVLFNPIAPVYLQRSTWQIFDYLAIAVIIIAGVVFARAPAEP